MRPSKQRRIVLAATMATIALAGSQRQSADAANLTWNGGGANDNWSTGANWTGGVPPTAGAGLLFDGSVRPTPFNDTLPDTLYSGITFNNTAGAFTLGGNRVTLMPANVTVGADVLAQTTSGGMVNNSAAAEVVNTPLLLAFGNHNFTTNSGAGPLTLGGAITRQAGSAAAFTTGGGAINTTLTNTNGIIGGWATIGADWASRDPSGNVVALPSAGYTDITSAGTITNGATTNWRFTGGGNINVAAGTIDINSLLFNEAAGVRTITMPAGTTLRLGAGGIYKTASDGGSLTVGTGGFVTAGGPTLNNAGELFLNANATTPDLNGMVFGASIIDNGTGAVTVVKSGNAAVQLNVSNSYTGGSWVTGGRLRANAVGGLGTGSVNVANGGQIYLNAAGTYSNELFLSGFAFQEGAAPGTFSGGAMRLAANGVIAAGTIHLTGDARIGARGAAAAGASITGKVTGNFGLEFNNTGTTNGIITLTNPANDWGGNTTISNGVLKVGATEVVPNGVGKGNVFINGGLSGSNPAVFDLNGNTETINGLGSSGDDLTRLQVTNSAPNPGMLILGDNNATATYVGAINNTGAPLSLNKIGSGVQTLTGNLTHTGSTTVTGGTLALGSTTNLNSSPLVDVRSGATLDVSQNGAFAIAGNQTFGGSGRVAGSVSMSDPNANLAPGQVGTAATLTFLNNLSLSGGNLRTDLSNATTVGSNVNDLVQVNGNLNLSGSINVSIKRTAGNLFNGTYTLMQYGGALSGSAANFVLPTNTRPTLTMDTSTPGAVNLIVGGSNPLSLIWSGGSNGNTWDLNNTQNFNTGSQKFFNWDSVTFDNNGSNSPDIGIVGTLEPDTITFTNSTKDYNFNNAGALINVNNVNKTGAGSVTFNNFGPNQFANVTIGGGTVVIQNNTNIASLTINSGGNLRLFNGNAGTIASGIVNSGGNLFVAAGGTFGAVTIASGGAMSITDGGDPRGTFTNNGSVIFSRTDDFNSNAVFAGTGTIRKQGAGQLSAVVSSPSFTGEFDIAQGRVRMNANAWDLLGSTSAGTVAISSGAQLDLSGIGSANLAGGFAGRQFFIAGDGPDTSGAILNNGQNQQNAFQQVTLTGDASIGVNARFDIRATNVAGVNNGTLNLNGFTLNKKGGQFFGLVNVNVTDGNILVSGGTLQLESGTNIASLSTGKSITLADGAYLTFFSSAGNVTRPVILNGNGTLGTNNNALSTVGSNILLSGGNLNVGAVNNNGTGSLTLNGNITESPGTPRQVIKNNTGTGNSTVMLNGANTFSGGLNVNGGSLVYGNGPALGAGTVTIASGATMLAATGQTTAGKIAGLSVAGGGTLNLNDGRLAIDYTAGNSPFTTIQGQIITGYAAGSWNGTGINSSAAATASTSAHKTALGYGEASAVFSAFPATFNGQSVDDTTVLVRYTYTGDANLDGKVDTLDFNALAGNFGGTGKVWTQADFNFDGVVDTLDFNNLAANFGQQLADASGGGGAAGASIGALVPEPTTLTLALFAATSLLVRRRRGQAV